MIYYFKKLHFLKKMLSHSHAAFINTFRSFTKYFAKTHEWIDINGDTGIIGVSDFAQHQMGEISFADFKLNKEFKVGDEIGDVESIKSTSPIFAPMDGTIIEVNPAIANDPTIINKSPEKDGWLCKMKLTDSSNIGKLMDEANYKKYLASR